MVSLANTDPLTPHKLTNKGNKMQSMKITTVSPRGVTQTFVQECRTPETALAIIKGTLEACNTTGWTLKEMSMA
jgi:hypothetical protein